MKGSKYKGKDLLEDGTVPYTAEENSIWKILFDRQKTVLEGRSCVEFIQGLDKLKLPNGHIPQQDEVNKGLLLTTGWSVEPVPAVIPPTEFFKLLANKKFPAASFIRFKEDLDYLEEPDIFHEVYGHCPLLTLPAYANFVEEYGKLALSVEPWMRRYLFRLFWFTIEFGLIKTDEGLRIMGGGILSSFDETKSALELAKDRYLDFDVLTALRHPYRIDMIQPLYFVLKDWGQLYTILSKDIESLIKQAKEMGDIEPKVKLIKQGDFVGYHN